MQRKEHNTVRKKPVRKNSPSRETTSHSKNQIKCVDATSSRCAKSEGKKRQNIVPRNEEKIQMRIEASWASPKRKSNKRKNHSCELEGSCVNREFLFKTKSNENYSCRFESSFQQSQSIQRLNNVESAEPTTTHQSMTPVFSSKKFKIANQKQTKKIRKLFFKSQIRQPKANEKIRM